MQIQTSISRLRKLVAASDVAYAASRQAGEDLRNAKFAVRDIESKINPRSGIDGVYETKDWNSVPKSEWPVAYQKAREVLAAAEAAVERQSEIAQHAGSIRSRALEFVREHHIEVPADLMRDF